MKNILLLGMTMLSFFGYSQIISLTQFASGFTDDAYQASVKIFAQTNKERQIKDLAQARHL